MSDKCVTVNARKYDRGIRRSWNCDLIEQDGPLIALAGVFEDGVTHPGLGHIRQGTISYEYYWLDRWYNIFRFHEPDGALRNFYCNIAMPPTFENGVLDYVDLDIDVVVWPGSNYEILDMAEFEENAIKFSYPETIALNVKSALTELIAAIENNELPGAS
jgi:protein associated with RNAse G/E